MTEIDRICIAGHEALALVGQEVVARQPLGTKDAVEKLLRQLTEKGYTARQIKPAPDGSRLVIWV